MRGADAAEVGEGGFRLFVLVGEGVGGGEVVQQASVARGAGALLLQAAQGFGGAERLRKALVARIQHGRAA